MYVTRISHFIYSVQYYPQFNVTVVGLGTYYPRIWGHYCTSPSSTLSYILLQLFIYSITQILVQIIINGIKNLGLAHTGQKEQERNITTGTTCETPLHALGTGRLLILNFFSNTEGHR
jgi:hypothetical protein